MTENQLPTLLKMKFITHYPILAPDSETVLFDRGDELTIHDLIKLVSHYDMGTNAGIDMLHLTLAMTQQAAHFALLDADMQRMDTQGRIYGATT